MIEVWELSDNSGRTINLSEFEMYILNEYCNWLILHPAPCYICEGDIRENCEYQYCKAGKILKEYGNIRRAVIEHYNRMMKVSHKFTINSEGDEDSQFTSLLKDPCVRYYINQRIGLSKKKVFKSRPDETLKGKEWF